MNVRLIAPNRWTDRNRPIKEVCRSKVIEVNPVEVYGKAIANIAGGFTAYQAIGGWINGAGELCVEPVTVFDCSIDSTFPVDSAAPEWASDTFRDLARRIARELRQDCVYLSINGKVEFVKG
jgi:hypothetical protein